MKLWNIMKAMLYVCLLSCLLIFATSFLPALYEPAMKSTSDIVEEIHHHYQTIAKELSIKEEILTDIIGKEDISNHTSSIEIQKRAIEALSSVTEESVYRLKEETIEQLAVQMQDIYDNVTKTVDTSETLQKIKQYSLIGVIISEMLLIIVEQIKKRKCR